MRKIGFIIAACVFVVACQKDQALDWEETNLLACCQLPISVLAPDSARINSSKLGDLYKDVTIKSGNDYFIQIYASEATTNDIAKIKSDQLRQVKEFPFFSKIVEEDENGFLYENIIDTTNINYSFRYVSVAGDMEYIFQPGLTGIFTEEQARRMYQAVQQ